ncbi:MAG TPA: hypothetical protein PKE51_07000 [Gemmatimonadaceae bacterium]|nr:hypothetical protein [Gemmatimonadaceae bacterium]
MRRYHSRIDRRAPGRVIVDAEGLMVRARESARLHPVQVTLHDDGQVEQRLSDGSVRPIALNVPLLLRPAPKVAGAGTLPLPHTAAAPVPSRPSMAPEQAGGRSRFVTPDAGRAMLRRLRSTWASESRQGPSQLIFERRVGSAKHRLVFDELIGAEVEGVLVEDGGASITTRSRYERVAGGAGLVERETVVADSTGTRRFARTYGTTAEGGLR